MKNIKNIIFDFGGVVLNIDYQLTINAFKKLGIENADILYSQSSQIQLFDALETGKINQNEFIKRIKETIKIDISDDSILDAWNKMILDIPKKRFLLLKNLRKKYKTYLLSNTNIIHYNLYINELHKFGLNNFDELFTKTFFSFQIFMRKPDKEIFEYVLKDQNLKISETLFIDDSIQHIKSAENIGLHTHHLTNGRDITELFDNNMDLLFQN